MTDKTRGILQIAGFIILILGWVIMLVAKKTLKNNLYLVASGTFFLSIVLMLIASFTPNKK